MSTADLKALNAFLAEARNAIVIGRRQDGGPHATPNWFLWDGERFFVSTTKGRVKYRVFAKDPRVQLVLDDATGFRYVVLDGTVTLGEDIDAGLATFAALRAKHGRGGQSSEELRAEMVRDERVLLMITPDKPQAEWLHMGF